MKRTGKPWLCVPVLTCMMILAGCGAAPAEAPVPPGTPPLPQESAQAACFALLSGDPSVLEADQWWVPDFQDEGMEYEYAFLDLDGDGIDELLVQMVDDPCGYNAVFHWEEGQLFCWNSDAAEMSCRDYPLQDGTMVRQYDYGGVRSYTLFRYCSGGEREELVCLSAREETVPEDGGSPCPWYEIDGGEVGRDEFDERLRALITDRLLPRWAWAAVESRCAGGVL